MMPRAALPMSLVLAGGTGGVRAAKPAPEGNAAASAASDLRAWTAALEMAAVDYGQYPEAHDIQALATLLRGEGYWESPALLDPWGRLYRCQSGSSSFRVWSIGPDGQDGTGDDLESRGNSPEPAPAASPTPAARRSPPAVPLERGRVGNTLTVTKSGQDLVLSWSPTGTTYDVVGAITPGFQNPYYLSQQATTTFTYANALTHGATVEYFDVTDRPRSTGAPMAPATCPRRRP